MLKSPSMANARGLSLSLKGGLEQTLNGGNSTPDLLAQAALGSELGETFSQEGRTQPPPGDHEAKTVDAGQVFGDEFMPSADDFNVSRESAEWMTIKATVDNLGKIFNDIGGMPPQSEEDMLIQQMDVVGSHASAQIVDSVATSTSLAGTILHIAEDGSHRTSVQADHIITSLIRSSSAPVLSIPSLAATMNQDNVGVVASASQMSNMSTLPRFTVTENGLERLSSEDRACLEEIERGSQLTVEEKEMLENSKKEFQEVLDFQDFDQDKTDLLNAQDLVNLSDQSLDYDAHDDQKFNMKSFPNFVIQNVPSDNQGKNDNQVVQSSVSSTDHHPSLEDNTGWKWGGLDGNNVVDSAIPMDEIELAISNPPQPDAPVCQALPNEASLPVDSASNLQTLQIILQDDQGKQQVITIDQKTISDSLQKIMSSKTAPEKDSPPIVCSLSDITVQDGFLVIPVDANTAERLPNSIDAKEPVVMTTNKNGQQGTAVNKQWMCSLCGVVYPRLSKLKVHIMTHTGERPYKCPVKGCKWGFTMQHKLKRHMERHQGTKDFVCEHEGCGKRFTTIYNLRTHLKWHQLPPKEFCTVDGCSAGFQNRKLLDKHLKEVHGQTPSMREKTFVCPHPGCSKRFSTPTCIGTHRRVHERGDDLSCSFCGKTFDKRCRLQQHLLVHTGERPFKCSAEGCRWAFPTASKLKRHMAQHLNERHFACPHEGCGKRFLRSEHLKGHLISHSGEKPFECPVPGCASRFSSKSSMYVHAKQHRLREKRLAPPSAPPPVAPAITYHCPMEGCEAKFGAKAPLKTHIEQHYQLKAPQVLTSTLPVFNVDSQGNLIPVHDGSSNMATSTGPTAATVAPGQSLLLPNNSAASSVPTSGAVLPTGEPLSLPCVGPAPSLISVPVVLSSSSTACASSAEGQSLLRQEFLNIGGLSLPAAMGLDALDSLGKSSLPGAAPRLPVSFLGTGGRRSGGAEVQGSARTDACINRKLMERAARRRQLLRQKAASDDSPATTTDVTELSMVSSLKKALGGNKRTEVVSQVSVSSAPPPEQQLTQPSEILTSRALTFRDPETGAILIQTQLLQDDPPNPDVYEGEGLIVPPDELAPPQLGLEPPDLASILADPPGPHLAMEDEMDDSTVVSVAANQFAGTTINLQDLE